MTSALPRTSPTLRAWSTMAHLEDCAHASFLLASAAVASVVQVFQLGCHRALSAADADRVAHSVLELLAPGWAPARSPST